MIYIISLRCLKKKKSYVIKVPPFVIQSPHVNRVSEKDIFLLQSPRIIKIFYELRILVQKQWTLFH